MRRIIYQWLHWYNHENGVRFATVNIVDKHFSQIIRYGQWDGDSMCYGQFCASSLVEAEDRASLYNWLITQNIDDPIPVMNQFYATEDWYQTKCQLGEYFGDYRSNLVDAFFNTPRQQYEYLLHRYVDFVLSSDQPRKYLFEALSEVVTEWTTSETYAMQLALF